MASSSLASVRASIESNNKVFGASFGEKNFAHMASLYTTDCKVMPTKTCTIDGNNNLEEFYRNVSLLGFASVVLTTAEVLGLADNLAVERGEYVFSDAAGKEAQVGKYIVVWQNVDGEWKLHWDIFNPNA